MIEDEQNRLSGGKDIYILSILMNLQKKLRQSTFHIAVLDQNSRIPRYILPGI